MRTNTGVTSRACAGLRAGIRRTSALVLVGFSILALCVAGCGKDEPVGPGPLPPSPLPLPSPLAKVNLQGYVLGHLNSRLSGVAIDIVDGPWSGAMTVTGADGRFTFPEPVELPVTLRLKRDGYVEKRELVRLASSDYKFVLDVIHFDFEPGNYQLRTSLDPAEATNSPFFPEAPCAGIPSGVLNQQVSATVERFPLTTSSFNYRVTLKEAMGPGFLYLALGAHDAAVWWETTITKDLGDFRYLHIYGSEDTWNSLGPISSAGSTLSVTTYLEAMYCRLSGPLSPANYCSQVPSSQRLDYHACSWKQGVMRFERQ